MPTLTAVVLGLAIGLVYGFTLERARIDHPSLIKDQMRLCGWTLTKLWGTAIATALMGMTLLYELGILHPRLEPTSVITNTLGGGLIGIGMTLAGGCPAMIMVQIGIGCRSAWYALAGGITGAIMFALVAPLIQLWLPNHGAILTIPDVLPLPYLSWSVTIIVGLFACIMTLERLQPWRSDSGPAADTTAQTYYHPIPNFMLDHHDPDHNPTHEIIAPPD